MLKNNYFSYIGPNADENYSTSQSVFVCLYIQQFIQEPFPSEETEEGEEYVQEWFFPYPEHRNLYCNPEHTSVKKLITANYKPVARLHCGFSHSRRLSTSASERARPVRITRWNNEKKPI